MAGYCFVIFLSVLAVGLSQKHWCCKTKSTSTDRCDRCQGAQCKQLETICPEIGKYLYETQCGRNTDCKESEHPEEYWYCNEDKKCASCKGEHGEFKRTDGGCPKGELHPNESLCKKSKACSNSSNPTAVLSDPDKLKECRKFIEAHGANQDYWICSNNGSCNKKIVTADLPLSPTNKKKHRCEAFEWCLPNEKNCHHGCDSYCEQKTEGKWHLRLVENKCRQCKWLECCSGAIIYDTKKACEKCLAKV